MIRIELFLRIINFVIEIADQTLGKTLNDGTKKFTLDEAIQLAGEMTSNLFIV